MDFILLQRRGNILDLRWLTTLYMNFFLSITRSHAVLEIAVKRRQKNQNQVMRGKLALVDLAGSERAAETNNGGQKLRDGANINRSLLALANCINALGKQHKKGLAYVPYRNRYVSMIFMIFLSSNCHSFLADRHV